MRALYVAMIPALLLAAAATPHGGARAEQVTFVVPSFGANIIQFAAAAEKGYFKEEGLEVEFIIAAGGTATAALIAGSVPYSASPSSAITAILRGAELKIVLITHSRAPYTLWSLVPELRSLSDIKGMPINITARGGTQEIAVLMLLDQRNLPRDHVSFSPMGTGADRVAGLVSGTQRIAVLSRTDASQLRHAGRLQHGHLLADLNKELVLPTGGLVVSSKELATNRERTRKFLRAAWKGTMFIRSPEHRQETIDILHRHFPNAPRDSIAEDIASTLDDLDPDGEASPAEAGKELAIRAQLMNIPPAQMTPAEKIYDFTLVREVIAELEAAGWRPGT